MLCSNGSIGTSCGDCAPQTSPTPTARPLVKLRGIQVIPLRHCRFFTIASRPAMSSSLTIREARPRAARRQASAATSSGFASTPATGSPRNTSTREPFGSGGCSARSRTGLPFLVVRHQHKARRHSEIELHELHHRRGLSGSGVAEDADLWRLAVGQGSEYFSRGELTGMDRRARLWRYRRCFRARRAACHIASQTRQRPARDT